MSKQLKEAAASINYGGGRKRIFIGMLCASCLVVCIVLFLILVLPWQLHNPDYLRLICIITGISGIAAFCWLCLMLVFHIYTGKNLPGIGWIRHVMIRLLLPLMEILARFLGINRTLVRRSFIKINNEFVLANSAVIAPGELLLLLPHCIQSSQCPRRLAFSLENCLNCGGCQIGYLRNLAKQNGFQIAVASGGTVARRIVVECKPKRIIAVACERDLISGIQDTYPIPVFGVLNERPCGPCRDTLAPRKQLEAALSFFLGSSFSNSSDHAHSSRLFREIAE